MMNKLRNWLKSRTAATEEPQPVSKRKTGALSFVRPKKTATQKRPRVQDDTPANNGEVQIESLGPGKNVLVRNKYVREETGTHETLKILDDSLVDSGEESGIDPYNTGSFDRSKNWTKRFRK
jgi:hypothetical protein